MKHGLVLEGGGMRGLFTAGIMDVMMENHIEFDGIIGVSAGASFGCNYKSRQPGRVLRYNLAYRKDPRFMGIRSFIKTGNIVGAEFAYHTLPTQLDVFDDDTYIANPAEFHVVCTDMLTGEPVYKRIDVTDRTGREWIRASGSMPLVSRPVCIDGYKLLDGAIADSIPLQYFQSKGYTRNIVILTQPKGFQKHLSKAFPLMRLWLRRYPKFLKAIQSRHVMYNEQLKYIEREEAKGDTLLIYPPHPLDIGRIEQNEEAIRRVYQTGRDTAEKLLPDIKAFMRE